MTNYFYKVKVKFIFNKFIYEIFSEVEFLISIADIFAGKNLIKRG